MPEIIFQKDYTWLISELIKLDIKFELISEIIYLQV